MGFGTGAVEDLVNAAVSSDFRCYEGARVLITGHSGFKGGWLASWLNSLGARVFGFALPPSTQPSLFEAVRLMDDMSSTFGDVRDDGALAAVFDRAQPQIVFHLAAQALVRRSYALPAETFSTNVMGTVGVLEAARRARRLEAVVIVTSDKCYENPESSHGLVETDPLGGADPYSSSKACAELVTAAYRRSFFSAAGGPLVASARAGNVLGGGDWSEDRLVPDIVKALANGEAAIIRNPSSIRPWQHVLEPLRGYLILGSRLLAGEGGVAEAWNFGPNADDAVTVVELARRICTEWGGGSIEVREAPHQPPESVVLRLDATKAATRLGYRPVLRLEEAVKLTTRWYRDFYSARSTARELTLGQIRDYMDRLT